MQSLFSDYIKNEPTDEGEKLEFESIMVYYVDEKEPTNRMQTLTTGLLTVTGVFILVACVGLLILVSSLTEIMLCIDRWQWNINVICVINVESTSCSFILLSGILLYVMNIQFIYQIVSGSISQRNKHLWLWNWRDPQFKWEKVLIRKTFLRGKIHFGQRARLSRSSMNLLALA